MRITLRSLRRRTIWRRKRVLPVSALAAEQILKIEGLGVNEMLSLSLSMISIMEVITMLLFGLG
jgi:hypothetical protein